MDPALHPHSVKRETPGSYGHPVPTSLHHMPPTETVALHNYTHPPHPGSAMPPTWNPAPSPYNEGGDHRHQHLPDASHHPQQYPSHHYPHPPPPPNPSYSAEPPYGRQGSTPATTRSPPSASGSHYHPPVNGAPHEPHYYQQHQPPPPPPPPPQQQQHHQQQHQPPPQQQQQPPPPPQDYRARPAYPHPESPANGAQPSPLHVATGHEMMAGPGQPPPPFGHPHSAGPHPSATPYPWPQYDIYGQRRKPVRAAQACDSCRQRKAKCDEGRPECSHCKDNNLKCTYRDVPPQKSEKQVMAITDKLESLSENVNQLMEAWKSQEDKINLLLSMQEAQMRRTPMVTARTPEESKVDVAPSSRPARSRPPTKEEPRSDPHYHNLNQSFTSNADTGPAGNENAHDDAPPKARGHIAASNLLSWPSIKALIPPHQTVSYVMDTESERGLLRLYGCGEGEDKGDGHDGVPSPAASSSSGRVDEDVSTSSPSGVWGNGQLPTRHPDHTQAAREHPGGVTPQGQLLLESKTIDTYFRSYLNNMHILHPFLEPRVLRKMVHTFKKKHSWDCQPLPLATAGVGGKRKRETSDSPGAVPDDHRSPSAPQPAVSQPLRSARPYPRSAPIEHSVANAIILLVIALGKICAFKDPLPGPISTSSIRTSASASHGYTDLPVPASAPTSPFASGANLPGPYGAAHPTSALQGKNMDAIPGLAYFAKAADIMGELPGGVDVSHVQANLLAGLYMGQLARIIPSHWYIANACRACQILVQSTAYKERKMTDARRNLINFAFWSCLQLESDILAEMDIPASGIVAKEASMLLEMPTGLTLHDPEKADSPRNPSELLRHYSYQIQLRRTINDALHNLYNPERAYEKPTRTVIEILSSNLESWRNLLGDWNWDDDDHQAEDINHARMRGKYYGAKYIIHRPVLHYALSFSPPSTPMSRPSDSPLGAGHNHDFASPSHPASYGTAATGRRTTEMRPPMKSHDPLEDWVLRACKTCVQAALRSTTAFDSVPKRLIITNIFGTAHAQFGNMLVLAATLNSTQPELRSLVDEGTFRRLLDRTIHFLQGSQDISPVLGKDAKILQHVKGKLFPQATSVPPPTSATSSFSSAR